MPSPPDVILVLSPRMAKLVQYCARYFEIGTEIEQGIWTVEGWEDDPREKYDALTAFVAEIDEQLAREATALPVVRREDGGDVARMVADKMAKAARAAVEPKAEDMSGADGIPQEPLVTEQDRADLAAEGERSPGVAPPDSEVQ